LLCTFVTIFLVGPFCLIALIGVGIVASRNRNPRLLRSALFPIALFGLFCLGSYNEQHYFDGVEIMPRVRSEEIVGTWTLPEAHWLWMHRAAEWIRFHPDGTYAWSGGEVGEWTVENGRLSFPGRDSFPHDGKPFWTAVTASGTLALLHPRSFDPDNWNLRSRFLKDPPRSADARTP
jgi:hypothetical protein